ncbi:MAG: FAD-dependent oxidoreductase [Geobacteraceae bacterium]|nr:FAD-dependent oxidoreductase [Geobacteraceae bacterium]
MKQLSCDLLVVGGGVAGVCAAIAASRSGVRTILVERYGYLAGTGYAGMLQHICGLYLNGESFPVETLNGGLTQEIVGLLKNKAPKKSVQQIGQVYVLPYCAGDLQNVFKDLLDAENSLTILRNTAATAIVAGYGNTWNVTLEASGETRNIAATMVVDCTGDGDVAAMAGAAFELSPVDERQLAGFSIRVSGLESRDDSLAIKVPYYCTQAVERNILPAFMKFTTFSFGESPDECFIKMSREGKNAPDRDERALADAQALFAYLGQVLPSFRQAVITGTSQKVMDREGRRIGGDYLLTEDDILAARKFPDAIARNAWPIELWDRARGTLYKYVPRGEYYEIPFRCITVKGMTNLLTAGRCISVSHAALGSTRVMGTCMALGEQAGRAGACFIRTGNFQFAAGDNHEYFRHN